ncbi:MAG: hypothetical protein ABL927_11245 [Bdellovibrionales bacterium]
MLLEDVFREILNNKTNLKLIINPTEDQIFRLVSEFGFKSYNFSLVLDELLINSIEHGKPPINFYYGQNQEYYYFGVLDFGPGIHETVPRNERLRDTKNKASTAIIRLSLEEGITGTSVVGRGMGLSILSKFIQNSDSEVLIASNSGYVKQVGSNFFEKKLNNDIRANLIALKINKKDLGL